MTRPLASIVSSFVVENDDLRSTVAHLETTLLAQNGELQTLRAAVVAERIAVAEERAETVRAAEDGAQELADLRILLTSAEAALRDTLLGHANALQALENQRSADRRAFHDLERRLDESVVLRSQDASDAKGYASMLEARLLELTRSLEHAEGARDVAARHLEERIEMIERLSTSVAEKENEIESERTRADTLARDIASLRRRLFELETEVVEATELRSRLEDEATKAAVEIDALRTASTRLEEDANIAYASLTEERAMTSNLRRELLEAHRRVVQTVDARAGVERRLIYVLRELEVHMADARNARDQTAMVSAQFAAFLDAEIGRARGAIATVDASIHELERAATLALAGPLRRLLRVVTMFGKQLPVSKARGAREPARRRRAKVRQP